MESCPKAHVSPTDNNVIMSVNVPTSHTRVPGSQRLQLQLPADAVPRSSVNGSSQQGLWEIYGGS